MPLYEYKCRKCRLTFEKIQKFSDEPEADCPKCGTRAERQLSAPAVHFKGSGWYITDSRKDKTGKADKSKGAGPKETTSEKSDSGDSPSKKTPDKTKE